MATPSPEHPQRWSQYLQAVLQWWRPVAPPEEHLLAVELEPLPDSQPSIHWVTDPHALPGPRASSR
jgi:hypothetical protein